MKRQVIYISFTAAPISIVMNSGRQPLSTMLSMPDLLAEYACKETARQKVRFINRMERFSLCVLDDWLSDTYSDSELSFLFLKNLDALVRERIERERQR